MEAMAAGPSCEQCESLQYVLRDTSSELCDGHDYNPTRDPNGWICGRVYAFLRREHAHNEIIRCRPEWLRRGWYCPFSFYFADPPMSTTWDDYELMRGYECNACWNRSVWKYRHARGSVCVVCGLL